MGLLQYGSGRGVRVGRGSGQSGRVDPTIIIFSFFSFFFFFFFLLLALAAPPPSSRRHCCSAASSTARTPSFLLLFLFPPIFFSFFPEMLSLFDFFLEIFLLGFSFLGLKTPFIDDFFLLFAGSRWLGEREAMP